MRTTLTIDDDVLGAARELADAQRRTIGEVITDLARKALAQPSNEAPQYRNGILLLPRREGAPPATLEMIKRLDEETP